MCPLQRTFIALNNADDILQALDRIRTAGNKIL